MTTSNVPATSNGSQLPSVRDQVARMTPEFSKALPGHIPAERFVRTIQTAVQMNPEISDACKTPGGMQSLLAACTKAATDGLIIDGREAALVTFNVKVSKNPDRWEKRVGYIPMVAGLMKKVRNSGELASLTAHVVYAKDKFAYILGDDERIEHLPVMGEDRGAPIAVYAIARLKDGSVQREVMDRNAVAKIAKQSRNADQYDPNKGSNYGEWWRKTVIRRISKYLPSSSDRDEFQRAVERIDEGFSSDAAGDDAPDQKVTKLPAGPKKRGGAAAALKAVKPAAPTIELTAEREPGDELGVDLETGEILEVRDSNEQPGDDI